MAKRVVNNEKKRIFSTTKNYGFLIVRRFLKRRQNHPVKVLKKYE